MKQASSIPTKSILSALALLASGLVAAQGVPLPVELLPLGKDIGITEGQTVTPAYEGWYEDDSGMIALSFGYYNRNTRQVVEVPVGPANRIIGTPDGEPNQGQPTTFATDRHWGVFTVRVPKGYTEQVVWHLENQGKTFHVPANLKADYIIDAIAGDANGNHPPQIRFSETAEWARGPAGTTAGPLQARVGQPLAIEAWVQDDGVGNALMALFLGGAASGPPPVDLTWLKQQGPGVVEFSESTVKVPTDGGKASTEVTFGAPGEYLLRARVTEPVGAATSGHAQCCWTNGFLRVQVNSQ